MEKKSNNNNCYLYFSAITASTLLIATGCTMVWSSPIIPKLLSNDTSINPLGAPITVLEVSLLVSLNHVGTIIGSVLFGKLPDMIGRKKMLIVVAAGGTITNVALYYAIYLYQFGIFILVLALFHSASIAVVPMYIVEVAEDYNRGSLGSFIPVMMIIGNLYGYGLGAFASVNLFFLLSGIPPFIVLIMCLFISESPIYFILKEDKTSAIAVLKKLGNKTKLDDIENLEKLQRRSQRPKISWRHFFSNRSVRRSFLLSLAIICFLDLTGNLVVLSFMSTLLGDAGGSLPVDTIAVIIVAIQLICACFATFIMEKLGRRTFILTGFFLTGLVQFVLGLYFYFKHNEYVLPRFVTFIPIIAILCGTCTYAICLSTPIFMIRSELLPNEVRSIGSSITQSISMVLLGITVFTYPLLSSYLGTHYCLFIFSFCCFSAFVVLFLLLPETKGKSFYEIKTMLESGSY